MQGGLLLWIAPSGGRDRPDDDMRWLPARFDPSAVELMRHLVSRAKPPGHLFPLAMHSGEMMPPPKGLLKSLGERRLTYFTGVGGPLSRSPTLPCASTVTPHHASPCLPYLLDGRSVTDNRSYISHIACKPGSGQQLDRMQRRAADCRLAVALGRQS